MPLVNMSRDEGRCKTPTGSHTQNRTYDEACAASSKGVMVSGERVALDMGNHEMKEDNGANGIDVRNIARTGKYRDGEKEGSHCM